MEEKDFLSNSSRAKEISSRPLKYLALGDSYTIGEGVEESESYPFQLVGSLAGLGWEIFAPTVVARTGWTTKELIVGIEAAQLRGQIYDLVTLLIGVNNQYRGEELDIYQVEFSQLLNQAISFTGGDPSKVIVLSIPDWGVTPFAETGNKPKERIAGEINLFNQANYSISRQRKVNYLDITTEYRYCGGFPENLVADQLHPSGNLYHSWAEKLFRLIVTRWDWEKPAER